MPVNELAQAIATDNGFDFDEGDEEQKEQWIATAIDYLVIGNKKET